MKNLIEANKYYLISGGIFTIIFLLMFFIYDFNIQVAFYGILLYFTISLPIIIYRSVKYKSSKNVIKTLREGNFNEEFSNIAFEKNELEKEFYNIYIDRNNKLIKELERNENLLKENNEYLTMWTHQVKTPISIISLIAENEENKKIKTEVLKANEYIDQMLNYMKVESFSQDYIFRSIKLNKLINDNVKRYKLLFFEKGLFINIEITDIDVITDEKWISFVIQQIIFNAIKYTEKGGIKIYNSVENPYCIFIEDTGIGIPNADIKNIFKWGVTGENGRLDKNSTGIGLYLADKVLRKFGYDYSISSEVAVGTIFSINLKRKQIIVD